MMTGTENSQTNFVVLTKNWIENCRTDEDVIGILSDESITRDLPHEVFLKIFSAHSTLPLQSELLQKLNPTYLPTLVSYNTKIADQILKTPALLDKLRGKQLSELSGGNDKLIKKIILQYLGYLERDPASRHTEKVPALDWILKDENYLRGRATERSDLWNSVRGFDLCSLVENAPWAAAFVAHMKSFLDKINGHDLVLLANSPDNVELILFMIQAKEERVDKKVAKAWGENFGDFLSKLLQRGDITTVRQKLSREATQNLLTGYNLVILSRQSSDIASYILSDEKLRGKLTFCNLISLYRQHADICRDQLIRPQLEKISTGTEEDEALCLGYLLGGDFFVKALPDIMRTLASSQAERSSSNNYSRLHFTDSKHDFHDPNLHEMDVLLAGYMFDKLKNRLIALQKSLRPIRMQDWESVYPLSYAQTYDFSQAKQESEKATQCVVWLYGLSYLYPDAARKIVRDPALRGIFKEQGLLSRVSGFHEEVATTLFLEKPEWPWRQEFNANDLIHLGEYHISIARKIFSDQALIEKPSGERSSISVAFIQQHPTLIEERNLSSDKAFFNQLQRKDFYFLVTKGTINSVRHSIKNKEEWERGSKIKPLPDALSYTLSDEAFAERFQQRDFRFLLTSVVMEAVKDSIEKTETIDIMKMAEERLDFYQSVTSSAQELKLAAERKIEVQKESTKSLLQILNETLAPAPTSNRAEEDSQACFSRQRSLALVEQFSACRVGGEDKSKFTTSEALVEKKRDRSQKSLSM